MKILFVTDNFPPEYNAPAIRTYEHCRKWIESGAEVTVITCFPNFPNGKIYKGFKNLPYKEFNLDGIKVIRLWSFVSANKGFIRRTIDFSSFAVTSSIAGLFRDFDIVITTSPQFFTNFTGAFLKIIKKKPWIMEVRDLWPESIATVGAMKKGKLFRLLEKLETFFYRFSDHIIVVTSSFKDHINEKTSFKNKVSIIYNGVNLKDFSTYRKTPTNTKKTIKIGYVGTHGLAHNLKFILESAKKIEQTLPNIEFVFVGDGAEKKSLKKRANELKLKNVTFHDPVPRSQVPALLSEFDFGLINLKKSETFKSVIPSKMFEISASHKPILMGVDGEAKRIVNKYKAGLCFQPENEEDFLATLSKISARKLQPKEFQPGLLAEAFNREAQALALLEIIHQVKSGIEFGSKRLDLLS